MDWIQNHLLSAIIFTPIIGALGIAFVNRKRKNQIRWVALIASTSSFLLAIVAFASFSPNQVGMEFVERIPWVSTPRIEYLIGADGLSLLMVLLSTFLTPLAILTSWDSIEHRAKEFFFFLLLLETGVLGVFLALDLFLFYVFWEAMLIPMYFLIGIWGHKRRIYATVKFILFTMIGSVLMLVGIIYLYNLTGSFALEEILNYVSNPDHVLSETTQTLLFFSFFIAFAIKVPLFPFHTWLPDAHVEAPTAGSVILAGVLLKTGTYGLLRFCIPIFPEAAQAYSSIISVLAIIGILYGGLVSMVQPDLKKLVAYSSISHLGFIVLGIFTFNVNGIQGAIYHMASHGISTGALFILVGMLYVRRHSHLIHDFGGLAAAVPRLSTFFILVSLSSLGLPLLNGFVGEFLIILGAFKARTLFGVLAALGIVIAATYILSMIQRVFFGPIADEENRRLKDCRPRELLILGILTVVIIAMGIYPQPFLRRLDGTTKQILTRLDGGRIYFVEKKNAVKPPVQTGTVVYRQSEIGRTNRLW